MFTAPRKPAHVNRKTDRLMAELGKVETQLQLWINSSEENAGLFRKDPVAAMRAAGLAIDDELICELEMIMCGIARKLK
ncbi:MAG TPA: hypothetical protein VFP59_15820 [Candidatus Angelobacter sp.]|nr:hypothetical protein [Candidatus Angelobacter sp.]